MTVVPFDPKCVAADKGGGRHRDLILDRPSRLNDRERIPRSRLSLRTTRRTRAGDPDIPERDDGDEAIIPGDLEMPTPVKVEIRWTRTRTHATHFQAIIRNETRNSMLFFRT